MVSATGTCLSWDLGVETQYQGRTELQAAVSFTLPSDGKYYLLGALYTLGTQEFISGTLFGVLVAEGTDYGANDPNQVSLFAGKEGEGTGLPCRFTLDRTDAVLGLFLLRMEGESPDLNADEQVGAVSTRLAEPAGLDITQLMTPLILVAMAAPVMGMVGEE